MSKKRTMKTQSERVNYGWYHDWTGKLDPSWAKRMFRRRDRQAAKKESRKVQNYDDRNT